MRPASDSRLSLKTVLPFSMPALPISALGLVLVVQLPAYFARDLGVALSVIGAAWGAVRLFDVPVDVLIAAAMDRSRTRFGRYRIWLIAGAPILMAALVALFTAPPHFTGAFLFWWLLVMYLGYSIFSLAHAAWTAVLAPRYHERSRLFGLTTAVGAAGTLAVMSLGIFGSALHLGEGHAVRLMGWLIIASIPLCVFAAALRTPEAMAPDSHTHALGWRDYAQVLAKPDVLRLFLAQLFTNLGPGWMASIYFFYFQDARGYSYAQATLLLAVYIFAQFPGALATSWVARRIGKHRTLMLSAIGYSLGLFSIFILPKGNLGAGIGPMLFEGVMATGFGQMIAAMLADVGDEIRLAQGRQRMSLLFAVNGLAAKIASAAAIALSFPLLARLGYHPSGHNTAAAIEGLQLVFLVGPIVFVMLGGACVIGWKLDAGRHDAIRAALEARDAAADAPNVPAAAFSERPLAIEEARQ